MASILFPSRPLMFISWCLYVSPHGPYPLPICCFFVAPVQFCTSRSFYCSTEDLYFFSRLQTACYVLYCFYLVPLLLIYSLHSRPLHLIVISRSLLLILRPLRLFFLTTISSHFMDLALTASAAPLMEHTAPVTLSASLFIGSDDPLTSLLLLSPLLFITRHILLYSASLPYPIARLTFSALYISRNLNCASRASIALLTISAYSLMTFTSLFVAFALYHVLCLRLPPA
jgi:hypothetical protein